MDKTIVASILFFSFLSTFSQSQDIQIKFIGNCGLYMTDGTTNIYIDFPYKSGAHNYMDYDSAEIDSIKQNATFIFTHKHADHYSKNILKKVLKEKSGQTYGPWNISELENLGETIPDFNIEAFETEHKVFGMSFDHYSYVITWHGKRIYLSGDTENADTIGNAKELDWAFVPAWLLLDSNEKEITIDAQMIGIYHIGKKDDINIAGEKVLMLKKQGDIISIPY